VLAIWLGLAGFLGRIPFTPAMTELLITITGWLGISGIEDVEDFYMLVSLVISLGVAVGIVAVVRQLLGRYR